MGRMLWTETGYKMAMVKASLTLFGGDTLVVRCSERCHIHLMSAKVRATVMRIF